MFGYGTPKGFYNGSFDRTDQLTNRTNLEILRVDYTLGDINLTSISSFLHNSHLFPEDSDAGPNNVLRVTYHVNSDTYTQEFRAAQSTEHFNWVGGVYYLHEKLDQNQPLSLTDQPFEFGFERRRHHARNHDEGAAAREPH